MSRFCIGVRTTTSAVFAGLAAAALALITALAAPAVYAATAIILGTTFTPDSGAPRYIHGAMENFVKPTTLCGKESCDVETLVTPEQFWPLSGWQDMTIGQSIEQGVTIVDAALLHKLSAGSDPVVIFGDSQSSTMLTLEKRNLADLSDEEKSRLTFVLVANPDRPNGGLLQRIAPFSIPFVNLNGYGATPTDTGIKTIDIVCQYDGIADFPRYPLNPFAMLNLIAGAAIHSSYITGPIEYTSAELNDASSNPTNQQTYGDTEYIMIPAKQLPLVVPLRTFGDKTGLSAVTKPIADLVEPTLRVLVELGYDRNTPYGEPAKFGLFPKINPSDLAFDLSSAAQSGVRAALTDLGFSTPPPAPAAKKPAAVKAPGVKPAKSAADRPQVRSGSTRHTVAGPKRSPRH